MDGRNSTGSKVSLLNDSSDVAPLATTKPQHQLPPPPAAQVYYSHHQHHLSHNHLPRTHSRTSSRASTAPSLSPQTPPLTRSDSSDSRVFGTPSPLTPAQHSFHHRQPSQDQHHHQQQQQYFLVQHRYGKMDDPAMTMYPPPDASNLVMPANPYAMPAPPVQQPMQHMQQQPQQQQQMYRASNTPSSEPSRVSTVSAASNSNNARPVAPKKNQYPCPLSKQFNCGDYFTT